MKIFKNKFNLIFDSKRTTFPVGIFKTTHRAPCDPQGVEYKLQRLQKADDLTPLTTVYPIHLKQQIRFKVDNPIWLTSIGMNPCKSLIESVYNRLTVSFEIKNTLRDKIVARQQETLSLDFTKSLGVNHIKFATPVPLAAEEWFTLCFTVLDVSKRNRNNINLT